MNVLSKFFRRIKQYRQFYKTKRILHQLAENQSREDFVPKTWLDYGAALLVMCKITEHSFSMYLSGYTAGIHNHEFEFISFIIRRGITPVLYLHECCLPQWVVDYKQRGLITVHTASEFPETVACEPNEDMVVIKKRLILISDHSGLIQTNEHVSGGRSSIHPTVCFNAPQAKYIEERIREKALAA